MDRSRERRAGEPDKGARQWERFQRLVTAGRLAELILDLFRQHVL
jgi:hypothetical protein